jgi:hypothetical protein
MRCCNPRHASSINMCGHHRTCNYELKTQCHELHLVFCLLYCCAAKATSSRSSTWLCDRESRSIEPSSSVILHQGGQIRFLGSILCDCVIASTSSSSWLIYFFVGRTPTIVVYNAPSSKMSGVFSLQLSLRKRKPRTFSSLQSCLS